MLDHQVFSKYEKSQTISKRRIIPRICLRGNLQNTHGFHLPNHGFPVDVPFNQFWDHVPLDRSNPDYTVPGKPKAKNNLVSLGNAVTFSLFVQILVFTHNDPTKNG